MTLIRDELEVVLEPKVFEVLLYLCSNPNRFISMGELHDNVWEGRCVSDAAVRRTISKLRLIFNDDHKVPQYIKSLPKRGYKLICQISSSPDLADSLTRNPKIKLDNAGMLPEGNNPSTTEPDEPLSFVKHHKARWRLIFEGKGTRKKSFVPLVYIVASIVIIVIFSAFRETQLLIESDQVTDRQVITALPGDKLAIAQSPDQHYLAFSGQVNQQSGYQVYIKQSHEPNFIPVTQDALLPGALAFSTNSKQLFYSDVSQGSSSLNRISLESGMKSKVDKLVANYNFIGDVFTSPDPKYVYFSGQKQVDQPYYIYQYDLINQNVNRMTSTTQKTHLDVKGAISPDGKLMAVLRLSKYEKSSMVRIIDLVSLEVLSKYHQDRVIYDLQWLNDKQLILLDKDKLYAVDYNNSSNTTLLEKSPGLSAFIMADNDQIIGLNSPKPDDSMLFFEQALPFKRWSTEQIYTSFEGSYFLGHQPDKDSKLILSYNNQVTIMGKLNTKTNQVTPYIKTQYSLSALASSSGMLELIQLNERFAILNTETQAIRYITMGDEFIGDAAFSADEEYVYYSIKNYEKWVIYRYHINSQTTNEFLSGFRYIRAFGENYIIASAKGDLFWYKSSNGEQVALGHKLSDEPNTHWGLTADHIYWSSHDLLQTVFHQLDISDITQPVESKKIFDYNVVRPEFTINYDGTSLIYRQGNISSSQLVRLSI